MTRLAWLWPYPAELHASGATFPRPARVRFLGHTFTPDQLAELAQLGHPAADAAGDEQAWPLRVSIEDLGNPDAYELQLTSDGGRLRAGGPSGITYAIQCLAQIALLTADDAGWPALTIRDRPAYRRRGCMVDLGRTTASLPMLKRLVRIYSRLRYNELHLRLYDDELCGLRFRGLPMGHDNPHAITLDDLAELARYAAERHMDIVPELESWGHVGAVVHHLPHLRGGDGVFAGSSFLICEETIALMRTMIEQVAAALPQRATIHLGFDEAHWYLGPGMPAGYTPTDLLRRYAGLLAEIGVRLGKELHPRVWADHAGRPLPAGLENDIIVQPWQYWRSNLDKIDGVIDRYSGAGQPRWMMCVGQSLSQYRGAYHATRHFCRVAAGRENLDGVTVAMWGWNDWHRLFITPFVGAASAWNPLAPAAYNRAGGDEEAYDRMVFPIMHWWQGAFRDAYPDAIAADRGPLVFQGHYLWGDQHRQPVSPSAAVARTYGSHDLVSQQQMAAT